MAIYIPLDVEHVALVGKIRYRIVHPNGYDERDTLEEAIAVRVANYPDAPIFRVEIKATTTNWVDDSGNDITEEITLDEVSDAPVA
jgi:hypothetical protein